MSTQRDKTFHDKLAQIEESLFVPFPLDLDRLRSILLRFLTTPYSSLGGFSVADVTGFSPRADTPDFSFSPEEALRALQATVDSSLAALTAEVKELKIQISDFKAPAKGADSSKPVPQKPSAPVKPSAPPRAPGKLAASTPPSHPSFAKVVRAPAWPSLVIKQTATFTQDGDSIIAVKRSPQEIVSFLNTALASSPHQVSLSAARWTKVSLVVTAGPDTTAHHLNAASHFISTTLSPFLSANPATPLPVSSRENVRWSRLLINGIPTGVSDSRGAYEPSECHNALAVDNPVYRTLRLTQLPSWVRKPSTYTIGSRSSLVIAFEDPDGEP
ncbi:hypothetical protein EI94DRAFT_225045 [Lactarius quietus]|nr:hypothetical protein EI94DRAFT_225045 [Lactarius quietus]